MVLNCLGWQTESPGFQEARDQVVCHSMVTIKWKSITGKQCGEDHVVVSHILSAAFKVIET